MYSIRDNRDFLKWILFITYLRICIIWSILSKNKLNTKRKHIKVMYNTFKFNNMRTLTNLFEKYKIQKYVNTYTTCIIQKITNYLTWLDLYFCHLCQWAVEAIRKLNWTKNECKVWMENLFLKHDMHFLAISNLQNNWGQNKFYMSPKMDK